MQKIQSQAVRKKYKKVNLFRIEIESSPKDLDFFVVDMTHTPIEFETEEFQYGIKKLNFPKLSQQVDMTVTLRDSEDERLRTWLSTLAASIDNGDGTSNPPSHYLKKVRRYRMETYNPMPGCFNPDELSSSVTPEFWKDGIDLKLGGYDFGEVNNINQLPPGITVGLNDYSQGKIDSVFSKYVPIEMMGVYNSRSIGRGLPIQSQISSKQEGYREVKTDEWTMFVSRVGEYSESTEEHGLGTFPVTFVGFRS